MNQWAFVAAAYGLVLLSIAALILWAWQAVRRAEADLEAAKRRP